MDPSTISQPSDISGVADPVARVSAYYRHTKHMPERYSPGPGYMDWTNQPDPFRRFSGARMVGLPVVLDDDTPPYDSLFHSRETPPRLLTAESLGEAEAAGVRSTGMGCYFDDFVHRLLDISLSDDSWQSLYHFTVGGAVDDKRLTTLPAYGHLPSERILASRRGGMWPAAGVR